MTQPTVHLSARCQGCNKAYRVPHPEHTYKCKACGGTVRAGAEHEPHEAQAPVLEGSVACEECQAISPGGTEYCVECGTSLPPSRAHPGSDAARRIRHEAAVALKRAGIGFSVVTWTYHFGAVVYAVAALFAVSALTRAEVPPEGGVLVVALTTLLSVLFGMGALHIHFQPFRWTLAIALVTTAATVVHLVGPNPFGLAVYGSAAWAVLALGLLVPTFWFQRLIATHRDLYVLHQASAQTRRALRNHSAHERHERLMGAMQRAARRAWRISTSIAVLVVLASVIGTWSVLTGLRMQQLSQVQASFETAWNGGDLEAVGELFDSRVREVESVRLAGLLEGHGWGAAPPPLATGRVKEEDKRASIDYALGELAVSTKWRRLGPSWALARVDVPIPSVASTFEGFLQAWRSSDPEELVKFYSFDSREEMLANIRKAIRDRGWRTLPAVRNTKLSEDEGGAVAILVLDEGAVTTEWHFRTEGVWRLHAFRLPKR